MRRILEIGRHKLLFFASRLPCAIFVLASLGAASSILYAQAPNTLWTQTFGGSSYDAGYSVRQTSDGGYIITGVTESYGAGSGDVWLIKTNSSGDTLWTKTFGGSGSDASFSVQQTSDGGHIITGFTFSFGAGNADIWLIRVGPSITGIADGDRAVVPTVYALSQNYPNPFNPVTVIEYALPTSGDVSLIVYNLRGHEVALLISGNMPAGNHQVAWDASSLSSGVYLYRLQAGDFVQTKKMVLLQ